MMGIIPILRLGFVVSFSIGDLMFVKSGKGVMSLVLGIATASITA